MHRYFVEREGSSWRAMANGKTFLIENDRERLLAKVRDMAKKQGTEVVAQDAYGRVEAVYRYDHDNEICIRRRM
jgi:hypothetical protein